MSRSAQAAKVAHTVYAWLAPRVRSLPTQLAARAREAKQREANERPAALIQLPRAI